MIRTLVLLALVQTVVNAGTANVRLRGILVLGSSICGCGGDSLIISGNGAGGGSFDPGIGACDSGGAKGDVALLCRGVCPSTMPLASDTEHVGAHANDGLPLVSIIIPCHNAMPWLDECLASCAAQDYDGPLEVSIYDDSSTDDSATCIRAWADKLQDAGVRCISNGNRWPETPGADPTAPAGGAGRARNKAIAQSSGTFLCFLDADDVMLPNRIRRQLAAARMHPRAIIGGGFVKIPEGATEVSTLLLCFWQQRA